MREFDKKFEVKEGQPMSEDAQWLLNQIYKSAEELVDKSKK